MPFSPRPLQKGKHQKGKKSSSRKNLYGINNYDVKLQTSSSETTEDSKPDDEYSSYTDDDETTFYDDTTYGSYYINREGDKIIQSLKNCDTNTGLQALTDFGFVLNDVGFVLRKHSVQIKDKITTEITRLMNDNGLDSSCSMPNFDESDCDDTIDSSIEKGNETKGKSTRKYRSILKKPNVQQRIPLKSPRTDSGNKSPHYASIEDNEWDGIFQPDWPELTEETQEEKAARELKEAKEEIETLRFSLKEVSQDKENVQSQLEFAKHALENYESLKKRGIFKKRRGKEIQFMFDNLSINNDGYVGTKPPKQLRGHIFRRG